MVQTDFVERNESIYTGKLCSEGGFFIQCIQDFYFSLCGFKHERDARIYIVIMAIFFAIRVYIIEKYRKRERERQRKIVDKSIEI